MATKFFCVCCLFANLWMFNGAQKNGCIRLNVFCSLCRSPFMIINSTLKGNVSYRDKKDGTFFVQVGIFCVATS